MAAVLGLVVHAVKACNLHHGHTVRQAVTQETECWWGRKFGDLGSCWPCLTDLELVGLGFSISCLYATSYAMIFKDWQKGICSRVQVR